MRQLLLQFTETIKKELEQAESVRHEIRLFSGSRIGSFAGHTYYRFETPEGIPFHLSKHASFTFGQQQPVNLTGSIMMLENQYLTVALPFDFGASIPETLCS